MEQYRLMSELTDKQRNQLIADLLDFFSTTPEEMNAKAIRELAADSRFDAFTRALLAEAVASLVKSSLLYRPPNLNTRDPRYVTLFEGRMMIQTYRNKAQEE